MKDKQTIGIALMIAACALMLIGIIIGGVYHFADRKEARCEDKCMGMGYANSTYGYGCICYSNYEKVDIERQAKPVAVASIAFIVAACIIGGVGTYYRLRYEEE